MPTTCISVHLIILKTFKKLFGWFSQSFDRNINVVLGFIKSNAIHITSNVNTNNIIQKKIEAATGGVL